MLVCAITKVTPEQRTFLTGWGRSFFAKADLLCKGWAICCKVGASVRLVGLGYPIEKHLSF